MEQFPHFAFWQDLGNLVAVSENLCLYICSLGLCVRIRENGKMVASLSSWTVFLG